MYRVVYWKRPDNNFMVNVHGEEMCVEWEEIHDNMGGYVRNHKTQIFRDECDDYIEPSMDCFSLLKFSVKESFESVLCWLTVKGLGAWRTGKVSDIYLHNT